MWWYCIIICWIWILFRVGILIKLIIWNKYLILIVYQHLNNPSAIHRTGHLLVRIKLNVECAFSVLRNRSTSPSLSGYTFQSLTLKIAGSEKIECLEGVKESLPNIFAQGLDMFLVKKYFLNKTWFWGLFLRVVFPLLILACFRQTVN